MDLLEYLDIWEANQPADTHEDSKEVCSVRDFILATKREERYATRRYFYLDPEQRAMIRRQSKKEWQEFDEEYARMHTQVEPRRSDALDFTLYFLKRYSRLGHLPQRFELHSVRQLANLDRIIPSLWDDYYAYDLEKLALAMGIPEEANEEHSPEEIATVQFCHIHSPQERQLCIDARDQARQDIIKSREEKRKKQEERYKQELERQRKRREEAAKQEAAKQEAAKQEAAKQEATEQEAAKQEATEQEAENIRRKEEETRRRAEEEKSTEQASQMRCESETVLTSASVLARIKAAITDWIHSIKAFFDMNSP